VRIDDALRRIINEGGDETLIAQHAFRNAPSLAMAARNLVRTGLTSPEEAIRVSRSEDVDA